MIEVKNLEMKEIYNEIVILKNMIASMKEEIEDRFLTAEEEKDIVDSLREFDDEKTISLEKLKEELCLN